MGDLGREERRQGRLCGSRPGPSGSATWSLFPLMPAWRSDHAGASGCWSAGLDQASIQVPSWRVRPWLMRLRRLRVAVRCLSQALFLAVPR